MNKTFIINGSGGSGKDTFVDFLKVIDNKILSVSSVAEIKEIAEKYFGYDGTKSLKNRKLLSDLKFLQSEARDGPFKYMSRMRLFYENHVMFFHIREPMEIEKFQRRFNAETILIKRQSLDNIKYGNSADDDVNNYKYDHIIINNEIKTFKEYANRFYNLYIM